MSRLKKRFWALPHWAPQKQKNNLKITSKLKVRIEGSMENDNSSATWVEPKKVFESYQKTPNGHF